METQYLEWKESWHDEHMKTLCAFANTSGGVLEIGRDDKGKTIGVANAKKLLEDLPNKIKNAMAIVADISLETEHELIYISVTVSAYPFPISYRGSYYIRSGSTTQELTGNALDEFILRKNGKTWDGVPVPYVKFEDFESDAFKVFRKKALNSGRLTKADLDVTDEALLNALQCTEPEYLKRAALLVFHQDPERWVPGAYVKIGMFDTDTDLRYQHEVHGPLVSMPDKVIEIVYSQYFKGIISYEGIQRVETFPVPHEAFREAITNAIVHRDYSTGIPIQIRVYVDKVIIHNDGVLPPGWSAKEAIESPMSRPHNPLIAGAFFRSGQIESWGRGIRRMTESCVYWGKSPPIIDIRYGSVFSITFETGITNSITNSITNKELDNLSDRQKFILEQMQVNPFVSVNDMADILNISTRNIKANIKTLRDAGIISRVGSTRKGHWVVLDSIYSN